MRQKSKNIFPELFNDETETEKLNKNVRHFRELYKSFDQNLQKYPEIEQLAHQKLRTLCKPGPTRSRTPDFTTQNLFRAVLVMKMQNLSYIETEVLIGEMPTLQNFCRPDKKETISFQLICQASLRLTDDLWRNVNSFFAARMIAEGKINPDFIRSDGTVVETNIHWPTDSRLCYDCCRTVGRIVHNARNAGLSRILKHFRFHVPKIKKLEFRINQNASAKSPDRKTQYRRDYKLIVKRAEEYVQKAEEIVQVLNKDGSLAASAFAAELAGYLPAMKKVVSVAQRRLKGEKVPNGEKVFSIFEPHTELIMKGKKDKPIELGHLLFLSQTPEKFVTDWIVNEVSLSETSMLPEVAERHKEQFGRVPKGMAMDKGCHPGREAMEDFLDEYEDEVEFVGIPARSNDFGDEEMSMYQRFRAGIEGSISFFKRCFGLDRVRFKGFKGFCRGVGLAIFCHNLQLMARRALSSE